MGKLTSSLTQRFIRSALRRGMKDGNRAWLAVGAAAWLLRLAFRPKKPKIRREVLRAGESVTIRNVPAFPRRRRRAKTKIGS